MATFTIMVLIVFFLSFYYLCPYDFKMNERVQTMKEYTSVYGEKVGELTRAVGTQVVDKCNEIYEGSI